MLQVGDTLSERVLTLTYCIPEGDVLHLRTQLRDDALWIGIRDGHRRYSDLQRSLSIGRRWHAAASAARENPERWRAMASLLDILQISSNAVLFRNLAEVQCYQHALLHSKFMLSAHRCLYTSTRNAPASIVHSALWQALGWSRYLGRTLQQQAKLACNPLTTMEFCAWLENRIGSETRPWGQIISLFHPGGMFLNREDIVEIVRAAVEAHPVLVDTVSGDCEIAEAYARFVAARVLYQLPKRVQATVHRNVGYLLA